MGIKCKCLSCSNNNNYYYYHYCVSQCVHIYFRDGSSLFYTLYSKYISADTLFIHKFSDRNRRNLSPFFKKKKLKKFRAVPVVFFSHIFNIVIPKPLPTRTYTGCRKSKIIASYALIYILSTKFI